MAAIFFFSLPAHGHVNPTLPLVRELTSRGHRVLTQQALTEHTLEFAFRAAAEATQEAVLNSLTAATEMTGLNGRVYESITKYL